LNRKLPQRFAKEKRRLPMTRITPARRAVLEHLASAGEASPKQIAVSLGRSPGSTRERWRRLARHVAGRVACVTRTEPCTP
jgi:DNA-binding MarR family transcriptional regulator